MATRITKKDWENMKTEAELQLKNAEIMAAMNQLLLDSAILQLEGYKAQESTDTDIANNKDTATTDTQTNNNTATSEE